MIERICPICNNTFSVTYNSDVKATCSRACSVVLRKRTTLEKYGVEVASQSEHVKQKAIATNMERYGTPSHLSNKAVREQIRLTTLEKYGTDNVSKSSKVKEKIKETFLSRYGVTNAMHLEQSLPKMKETSLDRYGVEHYSRTEEYKSRVSKTNTERYGHTCSLLNEEVSLKSTETKLLKYGVAHQMQSDEVKTKVRNTNLERYNVDNYSKTSEFKEQQSSRNLINTENVNENFRILRDKDVFQQYSAGKTISEISAELGVDSTTVYRYISEYDLDLYTKTRSSYEQSIEHFIRSLGIGNIVLNSRKIISPREIDIFLPDYNIGIEINGTYWHSDKFCDKDYHYSKFKECEKQGIKLLTIYTHRWDKKSEVYKAKISHMLGMAGKSVFARNCRVELVKTTDTRQFLDENHIQGYTAASINLGLYHENTLVALMTFSKCRKGIGKNRGNNAYELVRYATSCAVKGGASKLLSFFVNKYSPDTIISYSDNTYSSGNLYNVLGFELERENTNDYFYVFGNREYHRYNFAKYKLVKAGHDPSKTEQEIVKELGYIKIWGVGTRTWIWKNPCIH